MDGTTTNSDPSVRWCHRAHIDSNVSSDTFSCVIIRSKVGNLYFHSWLVSIHGHGPMTIYKRCQILSSFWQQQHRMDVHLCDWSVTYCKHFLWSYYKSDLAKKDLNFAIHTSQAPHVCQENTFFFFMNEIDNSACTIFFQSDNSCHCIFGELLFYMRY